MKLRSYFLTWVALGAASGIVACIFLSLKWLLVITVLMTLPLFLNRSAADFVWNLKMFLIGFVFGSVRIITHAKMIEYCRPEGFERASECAGHIISCREYTIAAQQKFIDIPCKQNTL